MLLTLAETARRLGVSEKTARLIAKDLPAVRVGKRYRYPADAVAAFANAATVGTVRGESGQQNDAV